MKHRATKPLRDKKKRKPTQLAFAENLKRECERFPSIAHVCRAVKINRQQFNKYLAGDNLPHARIRRRICEFLGVIEEEMFVSPVAKGNAQGQRSSSQFFASVKNLQALEAAVRACIPAEHPKPVLKDGIYFAYFPVQNHEEMLIRSLLKVTTVDGLTRFTRHTFFRTHSFAAREIAVGKHRGIVVPSEHEDYLIGINFSYPHHMSLVSLSRSEDSVSNVSRGLCLTRGTSQAFSCRACLEYLGNGRAGLSKAKGLLGVVHYTDKSVHPSVTAALSPKLSILTAQLNLPDLEKLFISAGPFV